MLTLECLPDCYHIETSKPIGPQPTDSEQRSKHGGRRCVAAGSVMIFRAADSCRRQQLCSHRQQTLQTPPRTSQGDGPILD